MLVHDPNGNVGVVVVEGLTASTEMLYVITHDNSAFRMTTKADIPIGHKVAVKDLAEGDADIGLVRYSPSTDLLLSIVLAARCATDFLHVRFGRPMRPGLLSHLRSLRLR